MEHSVQQAKYKGRQGKSIYSETWNENEDVFCLLHLDSEKPRATINKR